MKSKYICSYFSFFIQYFICIASVFVSHACPQCLCLYCFLCLKCSPPRPLVAHVAPVHRLGKGISSSGRHSSHSPPSAQCLCAVHNLHTHAWQPCPLPCLVLFPARFYSLLISHGTQGCPFFRFQLPR